MLVVNRKDGKSFENKRMKSEKFFTYYVIFERIKFKLNVIIDIVLLKLHGKRC